MPPEPHRQATYAIAISTFLQHPHFQVVARAQLFLETLLRYQSQGKFRLHGFAIMPTHVHLLLTPSAGQSVAKVTQYIKGGYSFAARKLTPRDIWHTGYHEHRVRDLEDFHNQLRYIANNPPSAHYAPEYPFVHTHATAAAFMEPIPSHLL